MKGYIIVSIGNDSSEDYICATGYDDNVRRVFFNKKTANRFIKTLNKAFREDNHSNPYEFTLEEVEIVTD
jgi:hypothetical protein